MSDEPILVPGVLAPSPVLALPPGILMWMGMYTALFYVCGGMIAYLYDPD